MKAETQIKQIITDAVKEVFDYELKTVHLEHPKDMSHGDYATNIAMTLTKELKRNPREIAQELVNEINSQLETNNSKLVSDIQIAGPGFINFKLSNDYFIDNLNSIIEKGEDYGKSDMFKDLNIIVEWTDPNPFKEFHIGHLYSNITGQSITNLLEISGANIYRVNYQGDVGMHVAKSIWGLVKEMESEKLKIEDLEEKTLKERIKFLGKAYSVGATAFEENEAAKEEMKEINLIVFLSAQKRLIEEENWIPQVDYESLVKTSTFDRSHIEKLYRAGRKWSLDYFETIYERLGTKFDNYYFESVVGEYGAKIVKENLKNGVFEESNGAIVFPGEKYGLHTRVFINSLGLPTYEAKELGLAPTKHSHFKYDKSIIITANEIDEYFKVLIQAMKLTNPDLGSKTTHLSHGVVKLKTGKMSSRTGKIITGEWLIDETKKRLEAKISEEKERNINEESLEKIAQAAVKYAFLKNTIGSDISFDFDESISFEGNSGPYIQYTYSRANSIIQKAERAKTATFESYQMNQDEEELIKLLARFEEVIESAAHNYSPSIICSYLFDLAQVYNKFYNSSPVIKAQENEKAGRILITQCTAIVIKNGLKLLGINVVERM